jgi:hypothetical protein
MLYLEFPQQLQIYYFISSCKAALTMEKTKPKEDGSTTVSAGLLYRV